MTIQDPIFPTNLCQETYESFFQKTEPDAIGQFATGSSLSELADCAATVYLIILRYNPILDTWGTHLWGNEEDKVEARQWEIDLLSEVKMRLAAAIVCKRDYYENHLFGIITKFFLKLFCMWDEVYTSPILAAEDFLLRYDLRYPVERRGDHYEKVDKFTPLVSTEWYQQNLNTENFFNYNPLSRKIPVRSAGSDQAPSFILPIP